MKNKGFSLIEVIVSLCIFLSVITLYFNIQSESYMYNYQSEKIKKIEDFSEVLTDFLRDKDYSLYHSLTNQSYNLNYSNGIINSDPIFLSSLKVIRNEAISFSNKNFKNKSLNIKITLKTVDSTFKNNNGHKNYILDINTNTPFDNKLIKGIIVFSSTINHKDIKITRSFFIFKNEGEI